MKRLLLLIIPLCFSFETFSQNIIGTWTLVPTAGALGVGPTQGDVSWWEVDNSGISLRNCLFDDSLVFDANGNFMHYMDGNTWLEPWQGVASEQCGTPVFPHDGSGSYTYTFANNQLTVNGLGAHIGLPKVINTVELQSPSNAATTITYDISWGSNGEMIADIQVGGGWWRFIYRQTSYCVINSTSSTIAQTVCESYTLNGQTYNSSGTYTQTLTNVADCDSIITLNLTVLNTSYTITDTVCESYTLNAQAYTSSGTYTQTLTNVASCDSTITLNLTVLNSTSFDTQIVCDSYTSPSGSIYTFTGIYIDTIPNSVGCDSVITLDLTITGNSSSSTIAQTVCDSYTSPSGTVYSSTGIYTDTVPNSVGCDSIITIDLTVKNSSSFLITQTVCGDYTLNGQTYTSGGTYTQALTNIAGCDSTITLNLIVNPNQFSPDFSVNQTLFTSPPFAAQFSNTTPNASNYNFTWDFSDGTILQSNNPSVFHEYLYNGLYDVTLIAEDINTGCTDTIFYDDYIFCTGGSSCTHASTINQTGPITACLSDSVFLTCNTEPNFTYQWRSNGTYIPGAVDTIYYPTQTGNFSVLILDNGCPEVSSDISVVMSSSPQTPIITSSGNITPCLGGSVTLSVPNTYGSYNWSTGGTSQTEVVTSSGDYTVTVTDATTGCSVTSNVFTVNASFMQPQQVCIVGMDSLTSYNRVVWEKSISDGIDSFYVYKEGSAANVYDLIGSVDYLDTALFVDVNSNAAVQAYRYKVSILDTCGTETSLGEFHKTIHLTINQGVGQTWNLIWNHYEGFGFPSYNIYRGTDPSNISLLTTIASNLNSYTDLNPPGGTGIYYQIEVVNANGCDPLKATDYGVSRSNIATVGVVNNIELISGSINIFPNPTTNLITIQSETELNNKFKIHDQQGREVMNGKLTGVSTEISLGKLSRGTYTIQVDGNFKPAVIIKQ